MNFISFMRFYFWVFLAFSISGMLLDLPLTFSGDFWKVSFYIEILSLVGIFGYCYSKNIFSPLFWMLFLPCLIASDLIAILEFETLFEEFLVEDEWGNTKSLYEIIIGSIFLLSSSTLTLLPAYVAIYLYGYNRNT